MRTLILAALLLPIAAAAGEFAARYPAGSIQDEIAAKTAQKDAEAELVRIAKDAKARDAECFRRILVNSCRDDVRRSTELAEREVKRVRVEARDVQRKFEADRVAKRRADEDAARAAENAQRAQKEEKSRAGAAARDAGAKDRADTAAKRGASATESQPKGPPKDRLTASERAENARKYEEKQAAAQKHAQQQEADRKENEKKREERRKQVEQREAEREVIRKKAEELVNQ